MNNRATRNSKRRLLLALGCVSAGGVVAFARSRFSLGRSERAEVDMFADYCVTVPPEAIVEPTTRADEIIDAIVPMSNPDSAVLDEQKQRSRKVGKNQVIEFRVSSGRKGALAVHGLSELVRIDPSRAEVVRFKAIYSGRFPLHFHGEDMSHFEISVLEIYG